MMDLERTRATLRLLVAVGALVSVAACSGEEGGGGFVQSDIGDIERPPECQNAQDCAAEVRPLGPCQAAVCLPGVGTCAVQNLADGAACDDGSACTVGDQCFAGDCAPGVAPVCDDGDPCTDDACDPVVGCVTVQNTEPCDDGNPCTQGDVCAAGVCVGGQNTCPCATDADCLEFDDGDLCNGTLFCATVGGASVCEVDPDTTVSCEPVDDPCQTAACDPLTGDCVAVPVADGIACEDGDLCTGPDLCEAGACAVGAAVVCDDGNPCTDDSCDPLSGCKHVDNESCGSCVGIECLGCAFGVDCASSGPFIDDTCCAVGDNLFYLQDGFGSEVVDLIANEVFSVTCGGFGADINNVTSPGSPAYVGGAQARCQRIAFGSKTATGDQVLYLAHHGDTWVPSPFLSTHHLDVHGDVVTVGTLDEPGILYEGMAWTDGLLLVAAHGAGLRLYETDAQGLPTFSVALDGFQNATKIAVAGTYAYVADAQGGLKVVSFADPDAPEIVQSLPTNGKTADVIAHQGRVFVALGGSGVDVFDASDPGSLVLTDHIDTVGSVQAVAADGDLLALAAWSHVAVHSVSTLQLLGTEQVRSFPHFDEILAVDVVGNNIFVGEWEGLHVLEYRQGRVGPDLWIEDELLAFDGDEAGARAVIMHNRGPLELEVTDIQAEDGGAWSVDKSAATIPPGEAAVVEVVYDPQGGPGGDSKIVFETNDPDAYQSPFELHLIAGSSSKIGVGDMLNSSFGFLDPTGGGQVANLQGSVVVLAYFALF